MRAGLLRHRVKVDAPLTLQDDAGDKVTTWEERTTVWGSIEPLTGREAVQLGAELTAEMNTRIVLRWSPKIAALDETWRLRHGATIYNIVSVSNVMLRNIRFEVLCKSGVNRG